jgi:hypothetical protein
MDVDRGRRQDENVCSLYCSLSQLSSIVGGPKTKPNLPLNWKHNNQVHNKSMHGPTTRQLIGGSRALACNNSPISNAWARCLAWWWSRSDMYDSILSLSLHIHPSMVFVWTNSGSTCSEFQIWFCRIAINVLAICAWSRPAGSKSWFCSQPNRTGSMHGGHLVYLRVTAGHVRIAAGEHVDTNILGERESWIEEWECMVYLHYQKNEDE